MRGNGRELCALLSKHNTIPIDRRHRASQPAKADIAWHGGNVADFANRSLMQEL